MTDTQASDGLFLERGADERSRDEANGAHTPGLCT